MITITELHNRVCILLHLRLITIKRRLVSMCYLLSVGGAFEESTFDLSSLGF